MAQLDLDLESASRTASSLQTVKLNVVVRKGQYTGSLYIFEYTSADSAETVLQKLRLYFNQHMSTPWTRFWLYSLLCRRLAIETATLASVDTSQFHPITVTISDSKSNKLLSDAFHHPKVLQHSQQHIMPQYPDNAIVLRPVLDKDRICYLLAAVLVVSPAPAAIVAWYTAKVEVGVSLCVGLFTMVSTIRAVIGWAQE
ncbi:MAG: hypothetical protein M1830_007693 [Pleopsidium flavum]|nr:MAG: hypothetical protein M1830_007693 [Pleopsidium flavum]